MRDGFLIHARGVEGSLINEVRQIGARKSGGAPGNDGDIDIVSQWNLADMNCQNSFAPFDIRTSDDDPPVKTPRTQQCRIENVGPVRGGNQNDTFVRFKAVHFNKQLVQRLFTLIMPTAESG